MQVSFTCGILAGECDNDEVFSNVSSLSNRQFMHCFDIYVHLELL